MTAGRLDAGVIQELRRLGAELGEDVLGEVAAAFEATAPPLVESLSSASASFDFVALRRAAHTLKSSSAQVGASDLLEWAKRIEAAARAERHPGLTELVTGCVVELGVVLEALAGLRGSST